ncbi:MAG: hypothetical protein M3Z25_03270, partial [Actinomycetota bacterium]|nr:hypothetical protein [Actinomycetota bacterium]
MVGFGGRAGLVGAQDGVGVVAVKHHAAQIVDRDLLVELAGVCVWVLVAAVQTHGQGQRVP